MRVKKGRSKQRRRSRSKADEAQRPGAEPIADLHLGDRVRALRSARGYTLKTVAQVTGLSSSLLSQIENAQVVPPIATLAKIAHCYGVTLSHFFEAPRAGAVALVRAKDRVPVNRRLGADGSTIGYRYLSLGGGKANKRIEPFLVEFDPRPREAVTRFDHEGEEFLYVLSGRIELTTPAETHVLEAGDAVLFDSSVPHGFRALGRSRARAVAALVERSR